MNVATLLHISRPRFWLYLAGPYLLGVAAGQPFATALWEPTSILLFLFFLVPANVFLYGINDWFDRETDALNVKKREKEHLLRETEKQKLLAILGICVVLGLGLSFWLVGTARWTMLVFLLLSAAYSVPPVRFKARPFFDSASNLLYALPGFVGYTYFTGDLPPLTLMLAASCWTAAMHLFSAIPDRAVDKKAAIRTTANTLSHGMALRLVTLLWFLAAFLATWSVGLWALPLWVYPVLPVLLLKKSPDQLTNWYWQFPKLNAFIGFLFFWLIIIVRFGSPWNQ